MLNFFFVIRGEENKLESLPMESFYSLVYYFRVKLRGYLK